MHIWCKEKHSAEPVQQWRCGL